MRLLTDKLEKEKKAKARDVGRVKPNEPEGVPQGVNPRWLQDKDEDFTQKRAQNPMLLVRC